MTLSITAYSVFCGDCLLISYQSHSEIPTKHIVADAGYSKTYHRTLSKGLQQLILKSERVSLFILTHTDNDHIGGVIPFLKENGTSEVDQFWMNYNPVDLIVDEQGPVSVRQGFRLRDLLSKRKKLNKTPILAGQIHQIDGMTLRILSPDIEQYEQFLVKWKAQEKLIQQRNQKVGSSVSDHQLPINRLIQRDFVPDKSWSNRSSIAFLLSVGDFTGMFTGDAHADVDLQQNTGQKFKQHVDIAFY
ncbi:ComEC/Rec2 family competence protein [Spirosoma pulveris]